MLLPVFLVCSALPTRLRISVCVVHLKVILTVPAHALSFQRVQMFSFPMCSYDVYGVCYFSDLWLICELSILNYCCCFPFLVCDLCIWSRTFCLLVPYISICSLISSFGSCRFWCVCLLIFGFTICCVLGFKRFLKCASLNSFVIFVGKLHRNMQCIFIIRRK